MSVYNITGWSGGGRRPLTYNLRAGQFRNMGGCNIFGTPTRTVINNNFGGYGYECDCGYNNGGGVPSWMQWCMGGGMVMNFLGQMMSAIFPGKESKGTEGKGAVAEDHSKDMTQLKALVKDKYNLSGPIDGKYYAKDVKTDEIHPFENFEELRDFVTTTPGKTKKQEETVSKYTDEVGTALANSIIGSEEYKDYDIKITFKDGKFQYKGEDGQEFNDVDFTKLKSFIKEHPPKKKVAPAAAAAPAAPAANSVKLESGQRWYDIAVKYKPANMSIREAIGQLEKANGLDLTMAQRRTNDRGPAEFAKDGKIIIPDNWKTTES